MSQMKIIPGDSQEELIKAAGQMITVYESGRHIKSAASRIYSRPDLERFAPPPGKFLSHMITMGASDRYGWNRNSDSFPHEQLLAHHGTFEKHAYNFREHKNQDPKFAIGQVKSARYDPHNQWGEILMWTDIDKAAAEFEKARKGEEQSGSMACSIDHDVCDCCGFQSKFANERCSHIKHSPGQYFSKFRKYAVMINIKPTFKDYSYVNRPADRIAHYLNYLMPMEKAAAESRFLRGDELAAVYGLVDVSWLPILEKIASFDKMQEDPARKAASEYLLPHAFDGEWDQRLLDKMSSHPYPQRVMKSIMKRAMVMPLATFHAYITGGSIEASKASEVVKAASMGLPGVRIMIVGQGPEQSVGSFGEAIEQFQPSSCGCDDVIDSFLEKAKDQFSLRYEALVKRAGYNPRKVSIAAPVASMDDEAFALASLYNAYLVKTAQQLDPEDWVSFGQLAAIR